MRQPDAQKSTIFFDIEALGEVQRVVVSIPGKETALAKPSGEFERCVTLDPHGDRRTSLIEALRIADAIKLQTGNRQQSPNEAFHQSVLMFLNGIVCGEQGRATSRH